MGKYDPLRVLLQAHDGPQLTLSFAEIAAAVGGLPASANTHRAWWANDPSHVQARAWLDAGFAVESVEPGAGRVQFLAVDTPPGAVAITDDEAESGVTAVLDWTVDRLREVLVADVQRLRRRHPGATPEEIARKAVKRGVRRVGWASFATGFGGAPLIAVNITSVVALQAGVVLCVAEAYGELDSPDIRQDIALIIGGEGAVQALKTVGAEASKDFTKRWVQKNVTRETMKKVNKVVSRKILTKAGEKSMTSFMKLVPLVGAGVGYAVDRAYARALGERAIRYYSGA